jgi:hypothetical protein
MTPPDPRGTALPHWQAACASLDETRWIDPDRSPVAAIHAAYYAMFHAARAVLVLHDGVAAAKTHRGVIARYAQLAGEDAAGREQARPEPCRRCTHGGRLRH